MNTRVIHSAWPVLVFLALRQVGPAWSAILGGFAVTTAVMLFNRRDRTIGVLTAYGFAILAICSIVGIAWNNEKAYLAAGPIGDFLFVPLYAGSVFIGKPLVGGLARELVPAVAGRIPERAAVFRWLSLGWAIYNFAQGILRTYLLRELSVTEYVILSRVFNLPLTGVMLAITVFFIWRAVRRQEAATAPSPALPEPASA